MAGQPPAAAAGDGQGWRQPPSQVGQDALLDFRMEVTLDGETLTAAEIREIAGQVRWARAGARPLG